LRYGRLQIIESLINLNVALHISDLYYKPMTIVNDDARVINKLEASLTDDARVVIYNCHMFIVQATDDTGSANPNWIDCQFDTAALAVMTLLA
jgi:hypothetical protein